MTDPPGLDLRALAGYLRWRGLATADRISASLISGGRSNLTYRLIVDDHDWVLRRPPLGEVLQTAHDMRRETTVVSALAGSEIPVPAIVTTCDDPAVIGAPFYVMARVHGDVVRTRAELASRSERSRERIVSQLVDLLAALHKIDPSAAGLAGFGRPHGFPARQVRRWKRQFDGSRTRELPGADQLAARLGETAPDDGGSAIVHGDYRLDNCIVRDERIVAVLDWEMSTLGDPLADLGMFVVYHDGLADLPNPVVDSPGRLPGVPALDTLLARYQAVTGLRVDDLTWYVALGWFKLAAILEGIRFRTLNEQTAGRRFAGVDDLVEPAIQRGLAALGETS